jgi:hypothetical protein
MFKFTLTDMTVTKGRRLSWAGCIQVQHCTAKMGTKMTQLYSKWKHWHGSLASHKGSPRSCTGVSTVELRPKIRNRTHEDILFQFCTRGLVLSEIFDHLLVLEPAEDRTSHFSTFTNSCFGEAFQQNNWRCLLHPGKGLRETKSASHLSNGLLKAPGVEGSKCLKSYRSIIYIYYSIVYYDYLCIL